MTPTAPARPCTQPGCPALVDGGGRCPKHRQRGAPIDTFYSSRQWRRFRAAFLAAHPLCEDCGKQGRLRPAVEVAHIIPRRQGGDPFDEANCRGLCKSCHSRESAKRGERWG